MSILEAVSVTKMYGKIKALDDFSLSVEKGVILGLVGPNGAGKSTFIKSMLGLLNTSAGTIHINGIPSTEEKSREQVAYLPEKFNFFPYYSVRGVLRFLVSISGVEPQGVAAACNEALSRMGIQDLADRKVSTLSKGQLQRVGLGAAIASRPAFLVMDEPFSGIDPLGVKEIKDFLREIRDGGATILVSSHILSEVERLCDEVCIVDRGKRVGGGKMADIVAQETLEDHFYRLIKKGGAS